MKKAFQIISTVLIFSLVMSCKKNDEEGPVSKPSVTTSAVTSVTSTAAVSGGTLVDDGGASISARGICFSTSANPTITNSTVVKSNGASATFKSNLTGLTASTTYYVRAYATNSAGTAYGSNELIFNTALALTTLSTISASAITGYSADCGVDISSSGGTIILSKGVCYGLSPKPTIGDNVTTSLSPLDSFSVNLVGLASSTIYYARAFSTTAAGTAYGNEVSFATQVQIIGLGESYNGGLIFYVDDSGIHGLIASTSDQTVSADWGCIGTTITGADGIAVGSGNQNTIDITGECTSTTIAAALCFNLDVAGFTDWSLPSNGELNLMNTNMYLQGLGNFSDFSYWSSTEVDANSAASFNFKNNTASGANKNSPYSVRAIRSF